MNDNDWQNTCSNTAAQLNNIEQQAPAAIEFLYNAYYVVRYLAVRQM